MSFWKRIFGGGKSAPAPQAATGCANCGGSFEWPASFKSGPIPIPAHVIDKAIFCPSCAAEFCIKCVRGKCPRCQRANFQYVVPGASRASRPPAPSPSAAPREDAAAEERDRGKHFGERSAAYIEAVTAYADVKDAARGTPMVPFLRKALYITMQKKTPAEIRDMSARIAAAIKAGHPDPKAFVRELEASEMPLDEELGVAPAAPAPAGAPAAAAPAAATPQADGLNAANVLLDANQLLRFRAASKSKVDAQLAFTDALLARDGAPRVRLVLFKSADPQCEFPWLLLKAGTAEALHSYAGSSEESDRAFATLFGDQPRSIMWADHIAENCPRPGEAVTERGRQVYGQLTQDVREGRYVIDRVVRA